MELIEISKYIRKSTGLDRLLLFIVLLGVVISGVSIFRGILLDSQVQVEYLSADGLANESIKGVFVDIEGAVINPGVYELSDGSRIKDVLVMAGGLSDVANREFCEKNLNMAEQVKDGQKIYIPSVVDTDTASGYNKANNGGKTVNINTASVTELDTLSGIGAVRADAIVKNRPYQNIDELVTKGVLSKTLVEQNREVMSVY